MQDTRNVEGTHNMKDTHNVKDTRDVEDTHNVEDTHDVAEEEGRGSRVEVWRVPSVSGVYQVRMRENEV